MMLNSNLVLFDMITTGFSEAINIGVPVMVYNSKFSYSQISDEGKKINDELEEAGIIFYDEKLGMKSFSNFINKSDILIKETENVLRKYIDMNSFPISKINFLQKMKKILK